MEYFNTAKAVRLKSNHGKYLYADDDGDTVRQERDGSSRNTWWTVELIPGDCHVIRLRSFSGKYLTATDETLFMGTSGKRVSQGLPAKKSEEASSEWEPRGVGSDSDRVRLRTRKGKYLRANGGSPPWRNSVTHDIPHRTKTQNWILWSVEAVDVTVVEMMITTAISSDGRLLIRSSSFSSSSSSSTSLEDEPDGSSDYGSPMSFQTGFGGSELGSRRESAMELFQKASVVRMRSHHDKYLIADDDEESVIQTREASSKNATWTVERLDSSVLRLKSCFGKYLTASNMPFLLGITGKKVLQTLPRNGGRLDSSVEWEPIREGFQVRLRTRYGQFLRANGGVPPWRNSVTHDVPHRTATQDWILWDVDVIQIRPASPRQIMPPPASTPGPSPLGRPDSGSDSSGSSVDSAVSSPERQKSDCSDGTMVKSEGRKIYYRVSDGTEKDLDDVEELSFIFNGKSIEELKQRLEEETEIEDISVCSRNLLNGKLYPLRLHLPPNNTQMHVVVVVKSPSSDHN